MQDTLPFQMLEHFCNRVYRIQDAEDLALFNRQYNPENFQALPDASNISPDQMPVGTGAVAPGLLEIFPGLGQ